MTSGVAGIYIFASHDIRVTYPWRTRDVRAFPVSNSTQKKYVTRMSRVCHACVTSIPSLNLLYLREFDLAKNVTQFITKSKFVTQFVTH